MKWEDTHNSVLRNQTTRNELKLWVFQTFQNLPLPKAELAKSMPWVVQFPHLIELLLLACTWVMIWQCYGSSPGKSFGSFAEKMLQMFLLYYSLILKMTVRSILCGLNCISHCASAEQLASFALLSKWSGFPFLQCLPDSLETNVWSNHCMYLRCHGCVFVLDSSPVLHGPMLASLI